MIEPINPNKPTPGELLRYQRQHIGWNVSEIANAMCLSPDLIQALEADDYSGMGGSTFILGYLRSYARLVGVDIEDAIVDHRDTIPEYIPDPDNIPGNQESSTRRTSARRIHLLPIVLVLFVLIVGAVFYFWPHSVVEDTAPPGSLTAELPRTGAGQLAVEAPADAQPDTPVKLEREKAIAKGRVIEALDNNSPLPFNLTLADIGSAVTTATVTPTKKKSRDNDAARNLTLLFDEGSWADVRDAEGERLLSQTVAGGSSVELTGKPPFTVFLGNADGVRVKYMGRIQTYSQSNKGLFARFTVGQDQ
ncbi:MAG: XRE family transcriptional regulator [marine bacterium B5-7]|nr:MAG: XRE family transcriptional regulator [marine bacterium B5-7]